MRIIILSVVAAISSVAGGSLPNKGSECEDTVICGEVVNASESSPKVLTVFPYNFETNPDRLASDISQSDFKFHQKFTMTHRHDVAINYNGEFYTCMAEACDSIFVTIDAKSKNVVFSGSKARFNTQLNVAQAVADSVYNKVYKFDIETDVEGIISQLNSKMDITRNAINECDVDDDVKEYLLDNALYTYANHIIMFDRENSYSSQRYQLLTNQIFDIYNSEKAHSYMYAVHIQNLMRDFMISDNEVREEAFKDKQDAAKMSELLLNHILKQPKSIMRDVILVSSIGMLKQFSDDIYDERFVAPDNYYNVKFMELYVWPMLQPKSLDSENPKSIEGDLSIESEVKYINKDHKVENIGDVNIIDYVKDKYKGKVIYIDVWASSCGPCLIEMKYAKDLHKMYDNVAFVNLCLSSKVEDWAKAIEENAIDGENYFVASDDVAKMIMSTYKLPGYPSYILIGSDGKIITTSAYRPSQLGKLSEQLEELL